MKKYLVVALGLVFVMLAVEALIEAKPASKAPIYANIKKFSPYYIEKRFGGLQILSRVDSNFKEKPNNMDIFHRFESLERAWGQKHLRLVDSGLQIIESNGTVVKLIPLSNSEDIQFLHSYYGIK